MSPHRSPGPNWSRLGLNGPGTYPIALRVYSTTNTVTAYSSLTIKSGRPDADASPVPREPPSAGVPYTINFSGHGGRRRELRHHRLDHQLG